MELGLQKMEREQQSVWGKGRKGRLLVFAHHYKMKPVSEGGSESILTTGSWGDARTSVQLTS